MRRICRALTVVPKAAEAIGSGQDGLFSDHVTGGVQRHLSLGALDRREIRRERRCPIADPAWMSCEQPKMLLHRAVDPSRMVDATPVDRQHRRILREEERHSYRRTVLTVGE